MDFVTDKLADGRAFRILTVVDQFTRECVWLEANRSMTGGRVAEALTKAAWERDGFPKSITCDNGLNASKKIGMSAEEVCGTQGMRLSRT